MDGKGVSLAPLLERLGQNPAALGLLGQLLSGNSDAGSTGSTGSTGSSGSSGSGAESAVAAALQSAAGGSDTGTGTATVGDPERIGDVDAESVAETDGGSIPAGARVLPSPPPGRDHGRGRREVLLALRPFLSERRCASVDRLLRALELYEVIEESRR